MAWQGDLKYPEGDHEFSQELIAIKERKEVLQRQLDTLAKELEEAENEMAIQGVDPFASGDQVVQCFDGRA